MANFNLEKLRELQVELSKKIILKDCFSKIEKIAGADIAYLNNYGICAVVVLDYKTLKSFEVSTMKLKIDFPYIPGFLAFREGMPIVETFKNLKNKPQILMIDGHGIAHPLGLGLASYVGLLLDIPTIGIAKSYLKNPKFEPIKIKRNGKAIYVSPGHKISMKSATSITLNCIKNSRLPEPLHLAHVKAKRVASKLRSEKSKGF